MELATVARPYAEAVFRLAREQGQLAAWSERLGSLAAYAQNSEVAACIGSPGLTDAQKAQLMLSLLQGTQTSEVAKFVDVLAANDRLAVLPEIHTFFETLKSAEEGVQDGVIHSAYAIDAAQREQLQPALEKHFKTRLRLDAVVEPELIGGIKVVVGDRVLDASVRGKLAAMSAALCG